MFQLHDLRESKVWQEAHQEGREEGEEMGSGGPGFEVQHMIENMKQTIEEMEAAFLNRLPVERRLRGIPAKERLQGIPTQERLQGIPTQERLQGIPTQERLQGIPEEELWKGLSEEARSRLRKLLNEESQE